MKAFKTLLIAGALLGVTAFGSAIAVSQHQEPLVVFAEGEGEETSTSVIPVEEEEPIPTEEEQSLKDKITELEKLVKEQANKIWNRELVSGLTIGGAIIFAMEVLLIIFRQRFNKKRETMFHEKLMALQDKIATLYAKYDEAKNRGEEFMNKACEDMESMRIESVELLKEVRAVIPELKQYEQFNQRMVAIINILDTISFTPENVKSGVAEKVKQLVNEVK